MERQDLITPEQIEAELGGEPTPLWMTGQNIYNLRGFPPAEVVANRRIVLHMIREAYDCGILIYDYHQHEWSLNSNFGDIMAWISRRHEIMQVIYELSNVAAPAAEYAAKKRNTSQ